mgnify:CR=1 FL=1
MIFIIRYRIKRTEGGKGVYKLDVNTYMSEPYITANYSSYNGMNGNNINDIYVDEEERIWLANYPTGITVRNNRYGSYDLIRHSLGNSRSLVNDQVHDVLEDSDGDLWFATIPCPLHVIYKYTLFVASYKQLF